MIALKRVLHEELHPLNLLDLNLRI